MNIIKKIGTGLKTCPYVHEADVVGAAGLKPCGTRPNYAGFLAVKVAPTVNFEV